MVQNSLHREQLKAQIRDAFGRITYTYTAYLKKMNCLERKSKCVKVIQIVLSAISTGGFLGSLITDEFILTCIGGLFSTGLLGLNLYFKDFNLFDEIRQHRTAADNLWLVRERYISLLTDFDVLSEDEIILRRDKLQKRTYEIYKAFPKTDSKSYADAQKALKFEEEQYFIPEEIDRMLPTHLRSSKDS